ncbi:helix-turn-helix domain-containing protein [Rhodococcus opacus]|uniref:helix-turn-helix domain-containing protein n=1 Tax=Rhodococcus opacus TaxID=37919 RepID=UPI001F5AD60B|nr:helix-turn-helix domain-containing protein [Rhodococcus opacus]UNN05268.1 helix-turn-helix domain-containing protein [Rhodococcus opacus]
MDCRRLAQRAGLAASTISRRLRVLAQTGWVTQTDAAAGTRAASWTLNLPRKVGKIQLQHKGTRPRPWRPLPRS